MPLPRVTPVPAPAPAAKSGGKEGGLGAAALPRGTGLDRPRLHREVMREHRGDASRVPKPGGDPHPAALGFIS